MFKVENLKDPFDFSQAKNQAFVVHATRLAFLLVVLVFTLSFQFLESRIDAARSFYPLYTLVGISFGLQALYLISFKQLYRNHWATGFLFFFEAFYVTGLIYYIGIQQSILIFLYLVNLILCGVLFHRRGALLLALWTSILFSFIVSLDTSLSGNTAYLAVGVNNLAFFTVAYLAGFLSEQLNIMGERLEERTRDVQTLRNLNDLILRNISSGLMTVDQADNVLHANPSAYSILDLETRRSPKELLELMPGLNLNERSFDEEFDFFLKVGGEKKILRVAISQLKDEQGVGQGRIISFQDQTHVRALENRVRQSEKMAAIGQLAAGIAHEIRNPLAGISGSIQLMQGGDSDAKQTLRLMKIVSREIDRLNNLITEFLDFAKPDAPMEGHVDLGALLSDLVRFTNNDLHQNVVPQVQVEPDLKVLGNRDKLRQAFLNIIVNAFQAVEKNDEPMVLVSAQKKSNCVLVSVKDNGMGMSKELKERIFEPFHTTKNKGTGLGLAITHSIFEAHNAIVEVESEPGEGTEFRVSFELLNSI